MASGDSEDEPRSDDPIEWFDRLSAQALETESFDPARAALATIGAHGEPEVRFVLVRRVGPDGFAFYTSYASPKAQQLERSPRAALAFHWASLGFQVRVRGPVQRLAPEGSDAYFATRPRGSQLAAWASRQSAPIATRRELEQRMAAAAARFPESLPVPRPEFWGGFVVRPEQIELWRTRDNRLHDRWLFSRSGAGWSCQRLQP